MASNLSLTLTIDPDAAARSAYESFIRYNAQPKRWTDLNANTRLAWRRIALSVLPHVTAVDKP
ncbi:MAG TPA: hypothetical protein VGH54_10355 [Mycobacterium sp.]|jgi:hypothetical protein|uniref:hypothetical protein n=1 Tax=Mycobacterium sp. TaxID=1785 RepID=UPI002F3E4446